MSTSLLSSDLFITACTQTHSASTLRLHDDNDDSYWIIHSLLNVIRNRVDKQRSYLGLVQDHVGDAIHDGVLPPAVGAHQLACENVSLIYMGEYVE